MGKTVAAVVGVVAAVAISIVAPYLAPLALGVLGITATATAVAIATAVIAVGLSVGLSLAFRALGVGAPSAKNAVGPPSIFRQTITNSFIVYGKRRVGGLLVFMHATASGDDHYRYFVIACAGHQCQGLVSFMLNDEVVTVDGSGMVTSGKYANAGWLWFVRGTSTDAANSTFVSECGGQWTTAHQGKGIAKIYAKFKLTDDVVQAGMPNITAIIEGRDEILDTRTSSIGYTRNAALIFYDWMKMAREEGGFGAYADEIPANSWINAQANVCDETVNSAPRYAIDAVITTGAAPSEIRDVMVVNQAGSYTYSGGKHIMMPGYWPGVSATLHEDDLAGPIQISPFMPSDAAANEVQGTYIDALTGYQGAPFTTQKLASPPTDVRQIDVDLAFVTNKDQADRIARIMLKRAQCEKTVVWPMNIVGLGVKALDIVQLDSARYGLSNYAFSVANWGFSADWGVVVSLREENAAVYDAPTHVPPPTRPPVVGGTTFYTIGQIQEILRNTFPKGLVVDAIDAGSDATIRIHGTAGTSATWVLDFPGTIADPTVAAQTLTGKSYSTLYYPYVDVATMGSAVGLTFGATTVYGDAINSSTHPHRLFLNQSVTTPAALGGTTTGGGSGGGYGGGYVNPGGGYAYP